MSWWTKTRDTLTGSLTGGIVGKVISKTLGIAGLPNPLDNWTGFTDSIGVTKHAETNAANQAADAAKIQADQARAEAEKVTNDLNAKKAANELAMANMAKNSASLSDTNSLKDTSNVVIAGGSADMASALTKKKKSTWSNGVASSLGINI